MDRMTYLSSEAAKAALQRQEVLANNLANLNTTGFRAELQAFRSSPIQGPGAATRHFALETTVGYNAQPGPVMQTGRKLDVAAMGNAWFAVQASDGTEAYTRAGGMDVSAEGQLTLRSGLPVQGDGGPIAVPINAELQIAADGVITAKLPNAAPVNVGRLKLVTPDAALVRGADGLFRSASGAELPADPAARLRDGVLEGSNVNAVETMVAMIAAARQFEHQMKLMQTAERHDQAASKLLSPTG